MSSNAVGFTFQADVVGVGSVTHLVAGRMLKLLSDAKVDPYAVAASIWLGKQIKVRGELEATVHPYLEARSKQGIQGFLIKALSIGWGHSEAAVELCRTKAGTNSILLIGALAAGSPPFWAAQCLSNLLSNHRCEADQIPNVDHLRGLVSYLAPIIQDVSGFSKVLEHISTSVSSILYRSGYKDGDTIFNALRALGEPRVIAAAIKQLFFTSERDESFYFVVGQGGAWFAAFASHIIGMSVQLLVGDRIVWETGGSYGRAIFQLLSEEKDENTKMMQSTKQPSFMVVDQPLNTLGDPDIVLYYALEDVISAGMTKYHVFSAEVIPVLHQAVARLSFQQLQEAVAFTASKDYFNGGKVKALLSTLSYLGIKEEESRKALAWTTKHHRKQWNVDEWQALQRSYYSSYMDVEDTNLLQSYCPATKHKYHISQAMDSCICQSVDMLLHGFATLAVALSRCRYQPGNIRIKLRPETLIYMAADSTKGVMQYLSSQIHHRDVVEPIAALRSDSSEVPTNWLGISAENTTIFLSCLVDERDTYDEYGRVITIASGRLAINGVLRGLIWERAEDEDYSSSIPTSQSGEKTKMAAGSLLKCHYRPSQTHISHGIIIGEDEVCVVTRLHRDGHLALEFSLSESLDYFLKHARIPPPCTHSPEREFLIPDEASIWVSGVDLHFKNTYAMIQEHQTPFDSGKTFVYALKGRKLEQVLQVAMHPRDARGMLKTEHITVLQLFCCVGCVLSQPDLQRLRGPETCFALIMAG